MSHPAARQVHLLVRDRALRATLAEVLADGRWQVQAQQSVPDLWRAVESSGGVAVLDWTMADGLLAEEHRHHLAHLTRRSLLMVLVPETWLRQVSAADLGVAALVPKRRAHEELLPALEAVVGRHDVGPVPASESAPTPVPAGAD